MVLRQLQDLLGGIYDVRIAHDVYDYVVTDRMQLPREARAGASDEQLIIAEGDDELAMSLYLDGALLERLSRHNPIEALHGGNVADYWTALEGVSHFLYLAWNAGHRRPISVLELELQAEVDKFVCSWRLLRTQSPERFPAELHRLLFDRTRIDERLATGRRWLYRLSNAYARRYCHRLGARLRSGEHGTMAELRRFYRLSAARKRAYIEQWA